MGELSASDIRDIHGFAVEALNSLTETMGASGSTSLPLSDQGTSWDAGAAAKSLEDADLPKAFFWRDPDGDANAKSSYKLGFAQRVDGTLTAIWRGVVAAAGALQGARGGVQIPDGDVAAVKAKVASYYTKAREKYDDDNIKPPWETSSGQSAAFLLAYAECGALSGLDLQFTEVDGEEILVGVGGSGEGMDQFLAVLAYWQEEFDTAADGMPDLTDEEVAADIAEADELGGKPNQGTKPDKRLRENKPKDNPEESALDAVDAFARYGDMKVAALAAAIIEVRPDLADHEDEIARIARRVSLALTSAAGDVVWGPEEGFMDLLSDVSKALQPSPDADPWTGPWACDVSVNLDKVLIVDNGDYYVAPLAIDAGGDPILSDRTDWVMVEDAGYIAAADDSDSGMSAAKLRDGLASLRAAAPAPLPEAAEVIPEASDEITPAEAPVAGEIPWHAVFLPEGKLTEDGRSFAPNAVILPPDERARDLPLSLMAMTKTSAEGGHDGAELAGRIDDMYRNAPLIEADGVFSKEEYGQMIARMVGSEELTGLSVDIAPLEYEWVPRAGWFDDNGDWIAVQNEAGEWEAAPGFEEVEDEPDSIEAWLRGADDRVLVITKAVIGMATVCPFPAFGDASIALTAAGLPVRFQWVTKIEVDRQALVAAGLCEDCTEAEVVHVGEEGAPEFQNGFGNVEREAVTAAAAGPVPMKPPAEWFNDPEFSELTPMTITEDGRIFGHCWQWETCHLSFDTCVVAPHSETNYAYFMLGEIECEDGERLAVGKITIDTGHAGTRLSRLDAIRHYDDTGTVAAYVCFGEDEHGGWFAGTLAPDLPEETLVALRGSTPSGDWRGVDGNLELVAILAVNVPGFPVPRGLVAAGADGDPEPVSLIAAGVVTDARIAAIQNMIGETLAGGHLVPATLTELIRDEIAEVLTPEE
jgi:hypothetical protein